MTEAVQIALITMIPTVLTIILSTYVTLKRTKEAAAKVARTVVETEGIAAEERAALALGVQEVHKIVNSQRTAMEQLIQELRQEIVRLKGETGESVNARELPE
jgi:ABC-type transporter Mla subunit MlaD